MASDNHPLDQRLTELEIKVSYADDMLDQLNALVYRQQLAIDRLQNHVAQLHQQLRDNPTGGGPSRNLRDDLPPHY